MRPRGLKLDRTRFYGRVSPSGKYFVTWIVANYKKEMKKVRNNKMETKCVLTLRQFDCDDGGIKVLTAVKREKHSIISFDNVLYLNLFMDDCFLILFSSEDVEIRSTETFKVLHNIKVGQFVEYSNGYLLCRPRKSSTSSIKY